MNSAPKIVKGTDPRALESFGVRTGDPSGFEGWTAGEVDQMLNIVRAEFAAITSSTSVDVASMSPPQIAVYIKPKNVGPSHASLSEVQPQEVASAMDTQGQTRVMMTKKSPARLLGIAYGVERSDLSTIDREGVRHEIIHGLTVNSAEIYEALTEGIVEYLSKPRGKKAAGGSDWRTFPWDSEKFRGTTGLRTPDYTHLAFEGTPKEQHDLYVLTRIIAMSAFQRQTHDQVWAICKTLHEGTMTKGTYPNFQDFSEAARQNLPNAEAQKLLSQLLFQEMRLGEHGYLLPLEKSHRAVLAQSAKARQNPDFGLAAATGMPDNRPVLLSSIPSIIEYTVKTSGGPGGSLTVSHAEPTTITPKSVAGILNSKNITVNDKHISKLGVRLRGASAEVV